MHPYAPSNCKEQTQSLLAICPLQYTVQNFNFTFQVVPQDRLTFEH